MRAIWARMDKWLRLNAPKVLDNLQPGATEEEIQRTENFFCIKFPKDVKESYLIHNGQVDEQSYSLFPHLEFLSLEAMITVWQSWYEMSNEGFKYSPEDIEEGVWKGWWHPKWIPLTYESNGACKCLDLAPEPGGEVGQIIIVEWQEPIRSIIFPNFRTWLTGFATELEHGEYRFSEDYGGLVDRSDV